ncbi:DNA polymerase III subunit delta' [Zhongshania guokunii]|uniref:DNA polymerase III subunit delta' n=1 Tax=Zhongshania guokunii TaxID=641783 RepID=A0ABV3U607_9GAMM
MSEPLHAYAWQMPQWQDLQRLISAERLPHALLLSGPSAIGKLRFAHALVAYLLCESPSALAACGQCRSCHFQSDGAHPDCREICPEEGKRQIGIDQVRSLQQFSAQHAHRSGGKKLVLIHPAEAMNVHTANALLKTLEEPASGTLLILVSHSSSQLLPTIRSRCLQMSFGVPKNEFTEPWLRDYVGDQETAQRLLAEAGGRPLAARQVFEEDGLATRERFDKGLLALVDGQRSPLQFAEELLDADILQVLDWWVARLLSLSRYQLADQALTVSSWQRFKSLPAVAVIAGLERALKLRGSFNRGVALNKRLILESLFLEWTQLCQNRAVR